jgi:hypothetical protein
MKRIPKCRSRFKLGGSQWHDVEFSGGIYSPFSILMEDYEVGWMRMEEDGLWSGRYVDVKALERTGNRTPKPQSSST